MLVLTFLINHFDLFGLRQVYVVPDGEAVHAPGIPHAAVLSFVRHPLYVGWLFAFWATPTMTGAHFLFATMTSVYILMAIRWEERDLITVHGARYERTIGSKCRS